MRCTWSWLLVARKLGSPNFFPVSVSTSLSVVEKRLMIRIRSWSWCWWWVWGQLGQGIFKVWLSLGKNTCPLYKNSPWPWSHCNMIPSRVVKRWTHQVAEGKSASMNKSKQQGRASLYNSVHLSRSIWQDLVSERRSTRQMFVSLFLYPPVSSRLLLHLHSFSFLVVHLVGHKKNKQLVDKEFANVDMGNTVGSKDVIYLILPHSVLVVPSKSTQR